MLLLSWLAEGEVTAIQKAGVKKKQRLSLDSFARVRAKQNGESAVIRLQAGAQRGGEEVTERRRRQCCRCAGAMWLAEEAWWLGAERTQGVACGVCQ